MDEKSQETAEKLFEMACNGDTDNLEAYYKITGSLDVVYKSFGTEHSLIMGAFRNQQWDTVELLLNHGAKLTASEQKEIDARCRKISLFFRMASIKFCPGEHGPAQ